MHKEAISDKEYVYKCYHYLVSRFSGSRIKTFLDFFYAFQNIFIHTKGYLPCTIQNELMRVMLIKSGRFEERDIQLKVMPFDFFIHQYLLIKIEGEWIPVDNGLIS